MFLLLKDLTKKKIILNKYYIIQSQKNYFYFSTNKNIKTKMINCFFYTFVTQNELAFLI